ncbi:hypothetical protein KIPB_005175, partial [Kipferlia bialata]
NLGTYSSDLARMLAYTTSFVGCPLTDWNVAMEQRLGWTQDTGYALTEGKYGVECGLATFTVNDQKVLMLNFAPHRQSYTQIAKRISFKRTRAKNKTAHSLSFWNGFNRDVSVFTKFLRTWNEIAPQIRQWVTDNVGLPYQAVPGAQPRSSVPATGLDQSNTSARVRAAPVIATTDGTPFTIIVAGYSIGGAIAQLCAGELGHCYHPSAVTCYTFGQPKVGNAEFTRIYPKLCPRYFRVVQANDPIPHLPSSSVGYTHVHGSKVRYQGITTPATLSEYKIGPTTGFFQKVGQRTSRSMQGSDSKYDLHASYMGVHFPLQRSRKDTDNREIITGEQLPTLRDLSEESLHQLEQDLEEGFTNHDKHRIASQLRDRPTPMVIPGAAPRVHDALEQEEEGPEEFTQPEEESEFDEEIETSMAEAGRLEHEAAQGKLRDDSIEHILDEPAQDHLSAFDNNQNEKGAVKPEELPGSGIGGFTGL